MLERRNTSRPAFLYLAFNGVHNANPADPLQAPAGYVDRFAGSISCVGRSGNTLTACMDRRKFAGMLAGWFLPCRPAHSAVLSCAGFVTLRAVS